ncbi:MAG: hypothetical protein MZV70_68650 [Desulfobacterales bacterium]|nr:hypothetical protein [Desulfobacterales bacterium]
MAAANTKLRLLFGSGLSSIRKSKGVAAGLVSISDFSLFWWQNWKIESLGLQQLCNVFGCLIYRSRGVNSRQKLSLLKLPEESGLSRISIKPGASELKNHFDMPGNINC